MCTRLAAGFNCDQRGSYDEAAAMTARDRTLAFFDKHLGSLPVAWPAASALRSCERQSTVGHCAFDWGKPWPAALRNSSLLGLWRFYNKRWQLFI